MCLSYSTQRLQFLIIIYSIAPFLTIYSSLYTSWVFPVCCPSPVLWYPFQRRTFPFLRFWIIPTPRPQRVSKTLERSYTWAPPSWSFLYFRLLVKFKSYCDRRSVGHYILVSCPFWSKWPDFGSCRSYEIADGPIIRHRFARFCILLIMPFPSNDVLLIA
jgi:hypothetical protein